MSRERSLEDILRDLNLDNVPETEQEEKDENVEQSYEESTDISRESSYIKRVATALRLLEGIIDTSRLVDLVLRYIKVEDLIKEVEKIDKDLAYILKLVLERENV
ncbi:MAG: hypothetical protein GXO10_04660 [Crenarchaeota archaeon]|nr:hypothetical protein [Thermoproteota archaeon]